MRSFIFNINAFCAAKSYLHILQSKIFHICRKANISHGEAVFHPFRKEWISLKTPSAFSPVGSQYYIYAIKKMTPSGCHFLYGVNDGIRTHGLQGHNLTL